MWTDNLKHFHFWCQKVLPLVYDDSLSYYEVLCKVTEHLNKLTTLVNEIGDELERYEGVTDVRLDNLETWRVEVDQWRANIDIWQGQINSWKDGIDSWKLEIDEWKTIISNWITNTVDPFITDMTNRVSTIETTLTTIGDTVKFQAERSMKIIPVTMHYNTDNNQFYLQEVTSFISGGRYPFEDYLTSSSLDTDATTNGSNLVFSIRDFYVDESTVDHQFPPSSMTTATYKTVKIKKATLYGGGYVQYNGHDVYFELDIQDIQTIYDPMDFFSPLLMYTPKSSTDSRPHRIVWVPRDKYIIDASNRIGIVEQNIAECAVLNYVEYSDITKSSIYSQTKWLTDGEIRKATITELNLQGSVSSIVIPFYHDEVDKPYVVKIETLYKSGDEYYTEGYIKSYYSGTAGYIYVQKIDGTAFDNASDVFVTVYYIAP